MPLEPVSKGGTGKCSCIAWRDHHDFDAALQARALLVTTHSLAGELGQASMISPDAIQCVSLPAGGGHRGTDVRLGSGGSGGGASARRPGVSR